MTLSDRFKLQRLLENPTKYYNESNIDDLLMPKKFPSKEQTEKTFSNETKEKIEKIGKKMVSFDEWEDEDDEFLDQVLLQKLSLKEKMLQ